MEINQPMPQATREGFFLFSDEFSDDRGKEEGDMYPTFMQEREELLDEIPKLEPKIEELLDDIPKLEQEIEEEGELSPTYMKLLKESLSLLIKIHEAWSFEHWEPLYEIREFEQVKEESFFLAKISRRKFSGFGLILPSWSFKRLVHFDEISEWEREIKISSLPVCRIANGYFGVDHKRCKQPKKWDMYQTFMQEKKKLLDEIQKLKREREETSNMNLKLIQEKEKILNMYLKLIQEKEDISDMYLKLIQEKEELLRCMEYQREETIKLLEIQAREFLKKEEIQNKRICYLEKLMLERPTVEDSFKCPLNIKLDSKFDTQAEETSSENEYDAQEDEIISESEYDAKEEEMLYLQG